MIVDAAMVSIERLRAESSDIVECQRYLLRRRELRGLEGSLALLGAHIDTLVDDTRVAMEALQQQRVYSVVVSDPAASWFLHRRCSAAAPGERPFL